MAAFAPGARDSMMVRSDARANGMVTSLTTRVAPRWRPTFKGMPASDVTVTHADGSTEIRKASSFRDRSPRMTAQRRTTHVTRAAQDRQLMQSINLGMDWEA